MSVIAYNPDRYEFELTMPLLIIGAGACGLVAALAAREQGIELAILERDSMPRGSTFMSSGFVPAANTRFQREADVIDDADLMDSDIQDKNHHESDPLVVRALADNSGPVIEWLADKHHIPFELVQGFLYPGHSRMRMHCTPRRTGEELMGSLLNAAEAAGVDIVTQATVTDLYVDDNQRIRGIAYKQPDGSVERLGCDVLLLACNGYGGNRDLVKEYLPAMTGALYYGHEGNQGEAILWGEKLGASLKDLSAYQGHGSLADPPQTLVSWAVMMQGGIQVNQNGQRFSNEHGGYSEQAAKVLAQPNGYVWNLFDERIHKHLLDFEDYQNALETKSVKQFDSIEAMADGLKLSAEHLQATFDEMHLLSAQGETDTFGRSFEADLLIKPPYYAIRVTGALFHTQGGLEITPEGRVLKQDGSVFPNLLAAGGAARGVSGSNDSGYLSGNGLLHAVVMGAIAGRTVKTLTTS